MSDRFPHPRIESRFQAVSCCAKFCHRLQVSERVRISRCPRTAKPRTSSKISSGMIRMNFLTKVSELVGWIAGLDPLKILQSFGNVGGKSLAEIFEFEKLFWFSIVESCSALQKHKFHQWSEPLTSSFWKFEILVEWNRLHVKDQQLLGSASYCPVPEMFFEFRDRDAAGHWTFEWSRTDCERNQAASFRQSACGGSECKAWETGGWAGFLINWNSEFLL